jgi:hypothetical protein
MDESQIVDLWTLFREYLDKKQPIEVLAERFVDMLADYGTSDEALRNALGSDSYLDNAISYYLDLDSDLYDDDEFEDNY